MSRILIGLLGIITLCSCAHILGSNKKVKIVTSSLGRTKEKAMYDAYQKNLLVQKDFGCNLGKGFGNTITKRIGRAYIGEATYRVDGRHCTNYKRCNKEWTRERSRFQAGGWIWWPGEAKDWSLYKADQKAKALALNQLVQECERVPKETKFHERCVDHVNSQYVVKVRASVQNKYCLRTKRSDDQKYIHKELTNLLSEYRKSLN